MLEVLVRCGECGGPMVALGNGAELSCSQPCGCTVSSEELFSATWNKVREYLRDPDHGTMNRTHHESGFFV